MRELIYQNQHLNESAVQILKAKYIDYNGKWEVSGENSDQPQPFFNGQQLVSLYKYITLPSYSPYHCPLRLVDACINIKAIP